MRDPVSRRQPGQARHHRNRQAHQFRAHFPFAGLMRDGGRETGGRARRLHQLVVATTRAVKGPGLVGGLAQQHRAPVRQRMIGGDNNSNGSSSNGYWFNRGSPVGGSGGIATPTAISASSVKSRSKHSNGSASTMPTVQCVSTARRGETMYGSKVAAAVENPHRRSVPMLRSTGSASSALPPGEQLVSADEQQACGGGQP